MLQPTTEHGTSMCRYHWARLGGQPTTIRNRSHHRSMPTIDTHLNGMASRSRHLPQLQHRILAYKQHPTALTRSLTLLLLCLVLSLTHKPHIPTMRCRHDHSPLVQPHTLLHHLQPQLLPARITAVHCISHWIESMRWFRETTETTSSITTITMRCSKVIFVGSPFSKPNRHSLYDFVYFSLLLSFISRSWQSPIGICQLCLVLYWPIVICGSRWQPKYTLSIFPFLHPLLLYLVQ